MPIAVEVVSRERFRAMGRFAAGRPYAAPRAEGNATATASPAAAARRRRRPRLDRPTGNVTAGAETPATTNQSATTNR